MSELSGKRILLTGSSGFLGSLLAQELERRACDLWTLDRHARGTRALSWPRDTREHVSSLPEELDAVIHLAGAPVAGALWTPRYKRIMRSSRVDRTSQLVAALGKLTHPPKQLLSASATGIYKPLRGVSLPESSPLQDKGFLGPLCQHWEKEALKAGTYGTQVSLLRTGLVLSTNGGLLKSLLPIWELGLGGRLGPGKTGYSWIHEQDWLGAVMHLLTHSLTGPFNLVSPRALMQKEFVRTLKRCLDRPAYVHLPGSLLKLLPGEMGRELFTETALVQPESLLASGYPFLYPELDDALAQLLQY